MNQEMSALRRNTLIDFDTTSNRTDRQAITQSNCRARCGGAWPDASFDLSPGLWASDSHGPSATGQVWGTNPRRAHETVHAHGHCDRIAANGAGPVLQLRIRR